MTAGHAILISDEFDEDELHWSLEEEDIIEVGLFKEVSVTEEGDGETKVKENIHLIY